MSLRDNCKLCGENRPLMNSHIIPRGLYARVQKQSADRVNELVHSDTENNSLYLSSKQLKQRLLCEECEARLQSFEDFYFRLVDKEPDRLARSVSEESDYLSNNLSSHFSEVELRNIAGFILSIFWRCNLSRHRELKDYHGALGREFSEELRLFLLGVGSFPQRTLVRIMLYSENDVPEWFSYPSRERQKHSEGYFWSHGMRCLNIEFDVFRGLHNHYLPPIDDASCSVRLHVAESSIQRSSFVKNLFRTVSSGDKRGKLKNYLSE